MVLHILLIILKIIGIIIAVIIGLLLLLLVTFLCVPAKRPMVLYWRRYGRAGGCQIPMGV